MSCDQVSELNVKIDSLQKDNIKKDREIWKLNKDLQHYEEVVDNLKSEMSICNYRTPDVSRADAAVSADLCCSGSKECGDEPVKDCSAMTRNEAAQYQEQMQQMESSSDNVRALREVNVSLSEEVHALNRVCAALHEECRVAALRAQFKDEIIREMRRQLRQAKAKLKESGSQGQEVQVGSSFESVCRRSRRELPDLDMDPNYICHTYHGSGDDGSFKGQ